MEYLFFLFFFFFSLFFLLFKEEEIQKKYENLDTDTKKIQRYCFITFKNCLTKKQKLWIFGKKNSNGKMLTQDFKRKNDKIKKKMNTAQFF